MEVIIEINNLTRQKINVPLIKKAAACVMRENSKMRGELSVVFVGRKRIKELNKKYRGVDYATDVLSFALDDISCDCAGLLGELIICPQVIAKDAGQSNRSFDRQVVWAVVHGILHLTGYDHEKGEMEAKRMRKKEEYYLNKFAVK